MNSSLQWVAGAVAILLAIAAVVFGFWFDRKPEPLPAPAEPELPRLASFPGGAAVAWMPGDRDQWAAFLGSSTGRRLIARLQATAAHKALEACQDRNNTADSAARIAGYADAIQHLLTLTNVAEVPKETAEDAAKPTADEELIARMSP